MTPLGVTTSGRQIPLSTSKWQLLIISGESLNSLVQSTRSLRKAALPTHVATLFSPHRPRPHHTQQTSKWCCLPHQAFAHPFLQPGHIALSSTQLPPAHPTPSEELLRSHQLPPQLTLPWRGALFPQTSSCSICNPQFQLLWVISTCSPWWGGGHKSITKQMSESLGQVPRRVKVWGCSVDVGDRGLLWLTFLIEKKKRS